MDLQELTMEERQYVNFALASVTKDWDEKNRKEFGLSLDQAIETMVRIRDKLGLDDSPRRLTDAEKKAYVEQGGEVCLYCEHKEIEGQLTTHEGDEIHRLVLCHMCSRQWYEVYTFTDVEEI